MTGTWRFPSLINKWDKIFSKLRRGTAVAKLQEKVLGVCAMYQSGLYYPFFSLPQVAALQQIATASLQTSNDPNVVLSLANNQGAARGTPFLKTPDLNFQPPSSSTISNSGNLDICESIRSDILRQINPDLMSHAIADVPGFIMESGFGYPAQGKMHFYAKSGK